MVNIWVSREAYYAESEEIGKVDIETLTMEQYLALDRGDTSRGVRRPEIGRNVGFEIKGRIVEIASLFNTPGVLRDTIMLWVSPLTLTGSTKRWLDRAPSEAINT
ncbi:hypothetical protein Tco_0875390 [Tanacetum coccineum]|uniref:Uncharacterized protein n=1 Tax=Tanacetum coccineum TaxID=301880 RepID=A0ABQ5BR26_9ASTR